MLLSDLCISPLLSSPLDEKKRKKEKRERKVQKKREEEKSLDVGVEGDLGLTIYGCMTKPDTESYETDLKCEEKTERTGICLSVCANVRRIL